MKLNLLFVIGATAVSLCALAQPTRAPMQVDRDPAIVKTLGSLGIDAVNATGDELAQTIQADIPLFRAALDAAGLLRTQTAR